MTSAEPPRPPGGRCPLCGRPRDPHYRPFCSARCRDRDLSHWLQGAYRIPVTEDERDDGEEPPDES